MTCNPLILSENTLNNQKPKSSQFSKRDNLFNAVDQNDLYQIMMILLILILPNITFGFKNWDRQKLYNPAFILNDSLIK